MNEYVTSDPRDGRFTDTRERIVATARLLFATKGFTGTSIKHIADDLGITKAAVYYHFPAKADLATAVFMPFVGSVDAMFTDLETRTPTRQEALLAYINTLLPHRMTFVALGRDPGVATDLGLDEVGIQWIDRMSKLLIGGTISQEDRVRVTVALSGLARVITVADVDDDAIRTAGLAAAIAALES